jgi:uncharacterized protein (DUF433 family)
LAKSRLTLTRNSFESSFWAFNISITFLQVFSGWIHVPFTLGKLYKMSPGLIYCMERIVVDPKIMHGKPVIKGTRVPVEVILGSLISGMSYEEIEREYNVKREDIIAAIEYAARFVIGEEVRPLKIEA